MKRLSLVIAITLLRMAAASEAPKTLEGHAAPVSCVAFSMDGKRIYSGDEEGNLIAWDVATSAQAWKTHVHTGKVYDVSCSADGRIATGGSDYLVRITDAKGGNLGILEGHQERVYCVRFAPDGKTLASCSKDEEARLWDLEKRETIRTFGGHQDQVRALEFLPTDANKVVTLTRGGALRLWDIKTGKEEAAFDGGHTDRVYGLAVSPDGKTIATAGKDKLVILWDLAERKKRLVLTGHTDKAGAVVFSPDGKTLASAGSDKVIRLWDSAGKSVGELTGCDASIDGLAFAPDGKSIAASAANYTVYIWPLSK